MATETKEIEKKCYERHSKKQLINQSITLSFIDVMWASGCQFTSMKIWWFYYVGIIYDAMLGSCTSQLQILQNDGMHIFLKCGPRTRAKEPHFHAGLLTLSER